MNGSEREKLQLVVFPASHSFYPPLQIITDGEGKTKESERDGREECRTRERESTDRRRKTNHHRGRKEERVTTRRTFNTNTYRTRREKHSGDGEGEWGGGEKRRKRGGISGGRTV